MRRLVPVAIVALAVTLSACGGGSGPGSGSNAVGATQLIATSADKAAAAKTARISGEVSLEVRGERQSLPLEGALDFGTGAFEFSYDMSNLGLPGAGDAKIEARMVDGVMYLNLGSLGGRDGLSSLTGGKGWMKVDLAAMGVDPSDAGGGFEANPGGALDALRGAGDVEELGTETLRGVETTHYRATVDPAKALEEAPAELREKARKGLEGFQGPIPIDVWIDGDGQARKIAMDIDIAAGRVSTTIEYYDFGVDVDVTAPPADDVFDPSDLLGGLGGFGDAFSGLSGGDRSI